MRYAEVARVRDLSSKEHVKPTARKRYRLRVAVEAVTVTVSVLALLVGQVTSIFGVLDNGTSADSILDNLTATALATAFAIIIVSALVDLFGAVSRALSASTDEVEQGV